jgi:hypothetical protein
MRTLAFLLCALFLLAASLQWNDPDPALWMAIYGLAALLAGAAAAGHWLPIPNGVAALVFGAGFLWLLPSLLGAEGAAFTSFRMQATSHEEPREAIGLLLCVAWCAAAARRGVRLRAEARDVSQEA